MNLTKEHAYNRRMLHLSFCKGVQQKARLNPGERNRDSNSVEKGTQ